MLLGINLASTSATAYTRCHASKEPMRYGAMRKLVRRCRARAIGVAFAFGALAPLTAHAETVLRVAMTAGDIPDWTGQPAQGFEGFRFVGWSIYDSFINWDLSRSDREAPLTPGLATKWSINPANNTRWIFERLRLERGRRALEYRARDQRQGAAVSPHPLCAAACTHELDRADREGR